MLCSPSSDSYLVGQIGLADRVLDGECDAGVCARRVGQAQSSSGVIPQAKPYLSISQYNISPDPD